MNLSFFRCLAACRTRSSAWDTLARSCARRVLCWRAFPSVPALRSTDSAAGCPALFAGFTATMAGSDFSRPCISGYGSSPSRCGPAVSIRRSNSRPPGSRAKSFRTCQGLRPRQARRALALARPSMLPSVILNTSALGTILFSRLNGWPMRSPADASPTPSRMLTHGRGRCGSLLLHRRGLAPPTLCRFCRRTRNQELFTKVGIKTSLYIKRLCVA